MNTIVSIVFDHCGQVCGIHVLSNMYWFVSYFQYLFQIYHFKKMCKEAGKEKVEELNIRRSDLKAYIPSFQDALKQIPDILKREKQNRYWHVIIYPGSYSIIVLMWYLINLKRLVMWQYSYMYLHGQLPWTWKQQDKRSTTTHLAKFENRFWFQYFILEVFAHEEADDRDTLLEWKNESMCNTFFNKCFWCKLKSVLVWF